MTRPVQRVDPVLPAEAMKTYGISSPLPTHFRPATCAEVDCQAHANGWKTAVDESTPLGAAQAAYIRHEAGRSYLEAREQGLTVFTFPAGQRCFSEHLKRLDRESVFLVRDGDWRGNPRRTTPRVLPSPEAWRDDFGEHQERLADRLKKG